MSQRSKVKSAVSYLDDFMLDYWIQPLDEGLHSGVLPQQLLQLLEDGDRVVCKNGKQTSEKDPPSETGLLLTSVDLNTHSLTLRVDVRVCVSASCDSKQRLRADAAQVHFVDVRHHAGHHGLVEQSRASNLEADGGTRLLWRFAVPVLCYLWVVVLFYLGQV